MTPKRLNIAVIAGGPSAEHAVSLRSGEMVVRALDKAKYRVKRVRITPDGRWQSLPEGAKAIEWEEASDRRPAPLEIETAVAKAKSGGDSEKVDVAFLAMHGPYGEDGTVQGLLETVGIPYTGSGVLASALAMDKVRCKELVAYHGIRVPRHMVIDAEGWSRDADTVVETVLAEFGVPWVMKSPKLGSSLAMGIVVEPEQIEPLIAELFEYDDEIMIEEHLAGTEITCSVLDNAETGEPMALPLTEIVPKTSAYFDYEAKYTPGATDEITPARVSDLITRQAQQVALDVHRVVGCFGLSRVDMIVKRGKIWFLEVNTIPGMTEQSLYPQAAEAAGFTFGEILDHLIEGALNRHATQIRFRARQAQGRQ